MDSGLQGPIISSRPRWTREQDPLLTVLKPRAWHDPTSSLMMAPATCLWRNKVAVPAFDLHRVLTGPRLPACCLSL